jgi:uncharacterized protein
MTEDEPVTTLTREQCWAMLHEHEFGRLAFHLAGEVHLAPVNYAVDQETLLFRTAEGSKLLGVVMNPDVAFEIDEYDDRHARSVVVRGVARRLEEDEHHRTENIPLRPWVKTLKYDLVEIRPTEVTGRCFDLARPWLHMLPER